MARDRRGALSRSPPASRATASAWTSATGTLDDGRSARAQLRRRGDGRRDRAPPGPGRARSSESRGCCDPGGVVYLALPDAGSRVARALGARWWSVLPTHVQYFTRASLARLLDRSGFTVEWMGTAPKAFTVRYYLERLEGYSEPLAAAAVSAARARRGLADRLVWPDFRDRVAVVARSAEAHERPGGGDRRGRRGADRRLTSSRRRGWAVDVYERWPGLGGQAATLDLGDGVLVERYYHHLFTSDRHIAVALPRARPARRDRVAALERGVLPRRQEPRLHHPARPAPLLAAVAALAAAPGPRGDAPPAHQRRDAVRVADSHGVDHPDDGHRGVDEAVAPAPPRQVRRPGRGDLDGLAVVEADPSPPGERARGAGARCSATPAPASRALFRALAKAIEERGGRVLIDRPAARLGADGDLLRARAGRAGLVPARPRPAHVRDPAGGGALRRGRRHGAEPGLRGAARAGAGRAPRARLPEPSAAGSSTTPRSACCSSSTGRFGGFYWTNVADPELPVRGARRADEPGAA